MAGEIPDKKTLLVYTKFDTAELFAKEKSERARQFNLIAMAFDATVAPLFTEEEKLNIREEFARSVEVASRGIVRMRFHDDIDEKIAVEIMQQLGDAGLAENALFGVVQRKDITKTGAGKPSNPKPAGP